MIVVLSFVLVAAQAAPSPTTEDDIIVVGERMRELKLKTKTDRRTGALGCVFQRRSGDAVFDATMCDALLACTPVATTRKQMRACMTPPVAAYARMLAERRKRVGQP